MADKHAEATEQPLLRGCESVKTPFHRRIETAPSLGHVLRIQA
jgi:hypothetical protein